MLGAAALAAGALAATGVLPGGQAALAHGRSAGAIARPSGPPAYFVDATSLGSSYTSPEIRSSATGTVVAEVPIGNVPALRTTTRRMAWRPPARTASCSG